MWPATMAAWASLGISYGGWLTTMALLDPHPALKAASEQASPADMFLGDDFHHNGAFRLSYGFEYAAVMETVKAANTHFDFDRADTYQWYLDLGPLSNVNESYFHGKLPTWNDFVNHPNYDEFWQKQAFLRLHPRAQGAQPERGRLVGPGGFLRPAEDLRAVRKERSAPPELPGGRPVEPRRLGAHGRQQAWATSRSTGPPASTSRRRSKRHGSPTG